MFQLSCFSQDINLHFKAYEDSLIPLGKIILSYTSNDDEKQVANTKFTAIFKSALLEKDSYQYNFDSIKSIAKLIPEDNSFKLYNWELPLKDGTYLYFGFIQNINPKTKEQQLFPLLDKSDHVKRPETATMDASNWYGAHYYKIIYRKSKGKKYYTLLGADWNNKLSKKKLIEVLTFTKNGIPNFGAPILNYKKGIYNRIFFEYSSSVSMSLQYDENKHWIIFDHLSPLQPDLMGQYQFYAPDLSFDAFQFKHGKWKHLEAIDARSNKE